MFIGDKGEGRACVDNMCFTNSMSTQPELATQSHSKNSENDCAKEKSRRYKYFCSTSVVTHYVTLLVLGLLSWGLLWLAWGDAWRWDGQWFRLAAVAVLAWTSGQVFKSVTTLPPLLAALTVGIAARNLGLLDIREYPDVDGFLRKIYPVIILGKGSLGWNLSYMRLEWKQLAVLGVIPWALEVVTLSICTQYLLGFPWLWGVMLGSFYASVSCPVLMPSVIRLQKSLEPPVNWQQLYCTAGGLDTMLSVGVFGTIFSYLFFEVNDTYRIAKAGTTLFIGVALGAAWGSLAKYTPHRDDAYVAPLRVLFVLLGGIFLNFFTLRMGWGGVGGVAVLACNATAALHWSKDNWPLNNNPAAVTYQVLWSTCEPILFAFTGTYLVLNERSLQVVPLALGILLICLSVRLTAAVMVSWKVRSFREKLFLCCTWTPKSIVEAVLCPMALNTLITQGVDAESRLYELAEDMVRVTVVAIYVTTTLAYLLTNHLGPVLLKQQNNKGVLPTAKPNEK